MNKHVWEEGWPTRVTAIVRSLGYPTLTAFFRDHPGEPYGKLARFLSQHSTVPVVAMQLQKLHMLEAIDRKSIRETARDTLMRSLRQHLRGGWNKGKKADLNRALAYAEWVLPRPGGPPEFEEMLQKVQVYAANVWNELNSLKPADEWLPRSTDDALIDKAFEKGWPEAPM